MYDNCVHCKCVEVVCCPLHDCLFLCSLCCILYSVLCAAYMFCLYVCASIVCKLCAYCVHIVCCACVLFCVVPGVEVYVYSVFYAGAYICVQVYDFVCVYLVRMYVRMYVREVFG